MGKLFNLARMTTATTGTGTITLGSAVSGFLTFAQSGVGDGDLVSYAIRDGSASEVGIGTYTASGTTLTRTVIASTNSNNAISLSGSAQVFITPNAADITNTQDVVNPTGSYLVSGGGVNWLTGYSYRVAAATYYIQGILYDSAEATITLDAADATNDRIDVIVVNSSSAAAKVTGTAASDPSKPDLDPSTQLELTFVLVTASSTEPATLLNTILYAENAGAATEWNWSTSGATWALASTNNPHGGTKDIEATSLTSGAYVQGEIGSGTIDLSLYTHLNFYLRSKATLASGRGIQISWRLNGVVKGISPFVGHGFYNFDSSNTSAYQLISIPIAAFQVPPGGVNQLRIQRSSSAALGFYIDDISITNNGATPATGGSGTDENAIHDNVANEIFPITAKTQLAKDDVFLLEDSAASYAKKKVTRSNLAPNVFNVRDYGATGDGVTDDRTAINLAIAALNTAGRGVLYFPAGSYLCSAGLTAITAACTILGDGMNSWNDSQIGSEVVCSSATAVLFTMNTTKAEFRSIALRNSNATPSAGAGVSVTHATLHPKVDFESVHVSGFYIGIDVQVGSAWVMHNVHVYAPVLYGIKIRNTVNVDAGGWSITDTSVISAVRNATSAIRIESSGGGKILNFRLGAGGAFRFANGIDLTTSIVTSILMVANGTIENVSGDGIHVVTSGTTSWDLIDIVNVEFGLYSNTTGNAINFNCGTLGDIEGLTILGCTFAGGTSSAAISLTKVTAARLIGLVVQTGSFTNLLTTSGCTQVYQGNLTVVDTYTDNTLPRVDGTTGAVLQSSLVTVDDNGTINIPTGQAYNVNGSAHTQAETTLTFTDVTTNNASTSAHGFLKKLDNDATHFMDGTGAWSVPTGTGVSDAAYGAGWDGITGVAPSKNAVYDKIESVIAGTGSFLPLDGWVDKTAETWTYASATTFTISGDVTTVYQADQKVKFTQTTVKYAIITAVAYSAPNTTITIYTGTDYTLENAAISANYYSPVRAPFGFPLDPTKWTVQTTNTSSNTQTNPVQNTWYNLGSVSINIPIGIWFVDYSLVGLASDATAGAYLMYTTLSTANNSESDTQFTCLNTGGNLFSGYFHMNRSKTLVLAAATTYYLNTRTTTANLDTLRNHNDIVPLIINARCAYL